MVYVDFKAVKAAVSIEDAANFLKLKLNASKTQLRGACPGCSNDDERYSRDYMRETFCALSIVTMTHPIFTRTIFASTIAAGR
jgi:hypothetical protein